jgi:hypothetical protein
VSSNSPLAPSKTLKATIRISEDFSCSTKSPAEQVARTTGTVCAKHFRNGLRAVILTGSLARGEETLTERDGHSRFASDAEFILILQDEVTIPLAEEIHHLRREIETDLALENIECHLSLSVAHVQFLRNMEPHIFGLETRSSGRVVYGESTILESIPPFTQSDIPREDAWRLLSNRMIEIVEAIALTSEDALTIVPSALTYRIIKLYLDMATSLLLFLGCYEPTYKARSERLAELASKSDRRAFVPFPLGPFSDTVKACTTAKLTGCPTMREFVDWAHFSTACQLALVLWKWELLELTRANDGNSPKELCLISMKKQPLAARLRGWAYAIRRQGWHRSYRQWYRWTKLARHASPRYWLYACVGEVFLRRNILLFPTIPITPKLSEWNWLWDCLPMKPPPSSPPTSKRQALLRAIAWNYHEFLEETRG